jgi:cysteine desulfurase
MIYLDNAATTRPCPEAAEAVARAMTVLWGNPSATHAPGREARAALEKAREQVLSALGAGEGSLTFTSGGTEADNLALKCAARKQVHRGKHIISSRAEHDAVLKSLEDLQSRGFEVTLLDPDPSGRVPVEAVGEALRPDTVLVSLMLVNNETGGVTDIPAVSKLLKDRGSAAILHTDAVQAFLKLPFTPKSLGADLITLSSHKICGPKGAGALWCRKGLRLPPLIHGGGQEDGLRSGTEPMPAILGFGAAAEAMTRKNRKKSIVDPYAPLRDILREELPGALFIGEKRDCVPYICSLAYPGARAEVLQNHLDSLGVCVSRGSACAKGRRSHVLEAMGLPPEVIDGALRVSFGPDTTAEEVGEFCRILREGVARYFPRAI